MPSVNDSKTTTEAEEVAAYDNGTDDFVAVILCDASGVIFDDEHRFYARGTWTQQDTQWLEVMGKYDQIIAKLTEIANATGGTVPGEWTPGSEDLIHARLENGSVRLSIGSFTPIQVADWPAAGGAEDPHDVLPEGHRPASPGVLIDRVFRDETGTPFLVLIEVNASGEVWLVTSDPAATDPLNVFPALSSDITFPLTNPTP